MMRFRGVPINCIIALAALFCVSPTAARTRDILGSTQSGQVRGIVRDGVRQFLGLPYAAPPVGSLRWRPPEKPPVWRFVRQAAHFGGRCPQRSDLGAFAKPSQTEDCLYLNIYLPDHPSFKPRAVMVWFPGGAQRVGSGSDYDGSALARRGDIMVITLNYRIGALGYLSHPAIDSEGHTGGNYGIMDQQAALRWVRDNIAGFGGDPKRVTIAGQSSGATGVLLHLIAPGSRDLFRAAIIQSAGATSLRDRDDATRIGLRFAADAGCAHRNSTCLRALSVSDILKHQPALSLNGPLIDGQIIDAQPAEAFATGRFAHVPIIAGLVANEPAFFLALAEHDTGPLTGSKYLASIRAAVGDAKASSVARLFPLADFPSPSLAYVAVFQAQTACSARRRIRALARYAPVYGYQFEDRRAPSYMEPPSFPMGAYHSAELAYLFDGFHGGAGHAIRLTSDQRHLSTQMIDAWSTFVRRGKPGAGSLPRWARYTASGDNMMMFEPSRTLVRDGYGARYLCELWDKIADRTKAASTR